MQSLLANFPALLGATLMLGSWLSRRSDSVI
jgi:hypothetical protein